MLANIAGTVEKEEKPEFEVIRDLIAKLDKLDKKEQAMRVDVSDGNVVVTKGDDVVNAKR